MLDQKVNKEWFDKAADLEDGCIVSAGSPEMLDQLIEQIRASKAKGKAAGKKSQSKKS